MFHFMIHTFLLAFVYLFQYGQMNRAIKNYPSKRTFTSTLSVFEPKGKVSIFYPSNYLAKYMRVSLSKMQVDVRARGSP